MRLLRSCLLHLVSSDVAMALDPMAELEIKLCGDAGLCMLALLDMVETPFLKQGAVAWEVRSYSLVSWNAGTSYSC